LSDLENCKRVPVTIITGFLGAGKTTLLRRILHDPRYFDTAVIVNEFGDIALDHELLDSADENLVETTAGCLCCTVQGDVRRTVLSLLARARSGEIRAFSRLVIETTGLADPAPVLHTFIGDATLREHIVLNGVITLVDKINGLATLNRFEEARRQIACADIVIMTKGDLPQPKSGLQSHSELLANIRALNAHARIIDSAHERVTPDSLFSLAAYDPNNKAPDVCDWLRYEQTAAHTHAHNHSHKHNHSRHDDGVRTLSFAFDAPLSAGGFWFSLDIIRAYHGERLLRLKGIVGLDDAPDQPVVIHGVQHILSEPVRLDAWPSEDKRTRIVVIAKDLAEENIRDVMAFFERPAAALRTQETQRRE
jgi:G3E family GTPase